MAPRLLLLFYQGEGRCYPVATPTWGVQKRIPAAVGPGAHVATWGVGGAYGNLTHDVIYQPVAHALDEAHAEHADPRINPTAPRAGLGQVSLRRYILILRLSFTLKALLESLPACSRNSIDRPCICISLRLEMVRKSKYSNSDRTLCQCAAAIEDFYYSQRAIENLLARL